MKARIAMLSGKYCIVVDSINGSDAYIYTGSRIECIAMAEYHRFTITYIAP